MKKLLLLILILAGAGITLFAQHFTISNSKLNVAYIAVENELSVAVEGVSADSVVLAYEDHPGWITAGKERGTFIFMPEKPGACKLDILVRKNGSLVNIGSYGYRIKYPPLPIGKLGWRSSGMVGLEKLQKHAGPVIALENFEFELFYTAVSFDFEARRSGQTILKHENKSRLFETPVLNYLNEARVGDSVIFTNMKVKALRNNLLDGSTTINNDQMRFVIVASEKDPYVKDAELGE